MSVTLFPKMNCHLTAIFLGRHDKSKADIRAIIEEAKELGGYEHLEPEQKQALLNALEESRAVEDTGIIRRPLAQLHDTRIVLEKVCREVCAHYLQCTRMRLNDFI
jgi:hypothetical protein